MKTTLVITSIFFLLGLKVSNMFDLNEKIAPADTIITTKSIAPKPINAPPVLPSEQKLEKTISDTLNILPILQKPVK